MLPGNWPSFSPDVIAESRHILLVERFIGHVMISAGRRERYLPMLSSRPVNGIA
jgi:hypothetical protein